MATTKSKPQQLISATYRGKREDLQGRTFRIPGGLPNPAKYIEEQYDAQQAEDQAKAEQERIEAERKALAEQRAAEAELEEESNDALEPVGPSRPVTITESGTDQLALAASLSNVTGSLLTQSREVENLQAQVVELKATVEALIAELQQAGIEKSQALKLVKNAQQMMNGLIESTSLQINAMQAAIREANTEALAYRQIMSDNVETVQKAADINESAIQQATAAASDTIDQRYDEFLAFLSFVLKALGLSVADVNQQINGSGLGGAEQFLTREYLATAASVMRSFQNAPEPVADVVAADIANGDVDPNKTLG